MGLHENTTSNLLVVGGTSSLSPQILDHAISCGYQVTATVRRSAEARLENVRWMNFDLEAENEPEDFLKNIKGETFTAIIFLIGETSLKYEDKSKYLSLHFFKTLKLLEALQESLEPKNRSSLIYVSSRAAIHPSFHSIVPASLSNDQ